MKICVVGHFSDNLDEGVRNVGKAISRELSNNGIEVHEIDIHSISQWRKIRSYHPDIIHFILCPTISGLIVTKFISNLSPKARTVISAIQPAIPNWKLLQVLKLDLVLVQSEESEEKFKSIGFQTEFLPNGVDIQKFKPVDAITKQKLRNKFGIPSDTFVILHLASFTRRRNLDVFEELQKRGANQVLIIGRENENIDKHVVRELQEAGCTVWIQHFSNIEEIYNLSDCYVFPTIDKKAAIEMPLSVLESMACNLSVITTNFGALPRVFKEGDGLFFVEKEEDFQKAIDQIKNNTRELKTREMVLPCSWENIAQWLEGIYEELLSNA